MPLYMDIHKVPGGMKIEEAVAAHKADLETQKKYGVDYKRYWVNANAGRIFCLVEAPTADDARRVHSEAHGLEADEIIEVQEGT